MKANFQALQIAKMRLGEAVLDPSRWPPLMDEICRSAGAAGAALLQGDDRTPDVPITPSVRETFARYYFKPGWHKRDVRARGVALLKAGVPVISDENVTTPEEMRTHPFFNECVFPGGLHWFAAIGFRAGRSLWALSIQRTTQQGAFGEEDKCLLAQLGPRLTEVATLSKAVGHLALESNTNALTAINQAAVALDRCGRVLEANAAMEKIIDHEDILLRDRRLWIRDGMARKAFGSLTERLMAAGEADALGGLTPIVIRRRAKRPIVMRSVGVPASARNPFLGARVVLTFDVAAPRPRPDMALLRALFALTQAEARLAAQLTAGSSLEQAAAKLAISRETARGHLKSVFAKTDTHRQGELVALLSRL